MHERHRKAMKTDQLNIKPHQKNNSAQNILRNIHRECLQGSRDQNLGGNWACISSHKQSPLQKSNLSSAVNIFLQRTSQMYLCGSLHTGVTFLQTPMFFQPLDQMKCILYHLTTFPSVVNASLRWPLLANFFLWQPERLNQHETGCFLEVSVTARLNV